jgi:cytochrome d ubiquinol oxidase subunit II
MGAVAGGIASGRVPSGGEAGDPVKSWINPTSVLGGVLAVVVCAYLAGVYLVWDARRLGDEETSEYFRRRVIVAAVVAGVIAAVGVFVLYHDANYVFDGLMSRALPLVIVSALCGIASLWLVIRGANRYARVFSMGAVASLIIGWGVAQWPYLLPTSLKVTDAAAPDATLATILIVFVVAAITIVPSLALLYTLDQKGVVQAEAAPIEPA